MMTDVDSISDSIHNFWTETRHYDLREDGTDGKVVAVGPINWQRSGLET